MVETGNPNSVSDAGVGALAARAAVLGAGLNVKSMPLRLKIKTQQVLSFRKQTAWLKKHPKRSKQS